MHSKIEATAALASYLLMLGTGNIVNNNIPKKVETPIHYAVASSYKNEFEVKTKAIHKDKDCLFPKISLELDNQIKKQIKEIEQQKLKQKQIQYDKDLYLLSNLADAESGSSWLCDEQQMLVVCVALNRVKSNLFPNILHDVLYQKNPKQYQSAWNGSLNKTPSDRAIKNAKAVLDKKYTCPSNVLFQSEHIEGDGIYKKFYNKYSKTTTYFCYINETNK